MRPFCFARFVAWAVALAACANPNDRPPSAPGSPPYANPGVTTTSAEIPQSEDAPTVGGEGYGGTSEYGLNRGTQGQPSRAGRGTDAGGGDILRDPIGR